MRKLQFDVCICFILATVWFASVSVADEYRTWEPVTIDASGPRMSETGDANPFRDVLMIVTFRNGETEHRVHGYFAADGDAANSGAEDGNVWRAHFVPEAPGEWHYEVSLRSGDDIALSGGPEAGQPVEGDGVAGTINVLENPDTDGMLQYVDQRYLHWSGSGQPYLKSGVDSPENLLGYADFDDTRKLGNGRLHHYEPHVQDWNAGDPVWDDGRGKGLIGAVNYLAEQGVNSMYFIPMNIGGDGKDVWPYTSPEVRDRFDCSRLDQWEIVFSHMDRKGIMLHMILTETENESLFEVEEGGDFADARKLYFRELVARFAHHSAVEWNLGEENGGPDEPELDAPHRGNTDAQRMAFAAYIRHLDPYDHPIVVHTFPGNDWYQNIYLPLLGQGMFEGPSIQIGADGNIHEVTKEWLRRSAEAGRQWFVCVDEQGPANTGVKPDADDPTHDQIRRNVLWANLMAGGSGCEWYFGYQFAHNDLNCEDFRSRDEMYRQTRIALKFFHEHLPFPEMVSADDLLTDNDCWCFAQPGEVYAVYLPPGDRTRIRLPQADFRVQWFDPRTGGELQEGSVAEIEGGEPTSPGEPPDHPDQDWVVLIRRVTGNLSGRIRVRGEIPELPPLVRMEADIRDLECAEKEIPDESLLVSDMGGLTNVFVYLIKTPEHLKGLDRSKQRTSLSTAECRFTPHATIVRAPTDAHFPRENGTVHNPRLHTSRGTQVGQIISPTNREIVKPIEFSERVTPVLVTCDIHVWMRAWILPLDHSYAA